MSSASDFRTALSTAWAWVEASSGIILKLGGISALIASVFEIGSFYALASEPRIFLFWMGLFMWATGGLARSEQKEAGRLERELERCREQRDEYKELYLEQASNQYDD